MNQRRDLIIVLAVAMGLVAVWLVLPTPREPVASSGFVVEHVLLFDGDRFQEDVDVWVDHGRIKAVGTDLDVPDTIERIPAHGRTLMPGLIDAHTHVFGDALKHAIAFGVTTELDMFSPVQQVQVARLDRDELAPRSRADLFSAGTLVTASGGHGTEYGFPIPTLDSAEDAEAFVGARLAEGSDFIKAVLDNGNAFGIDWPTLDDETLAAVGSAARARNVLMVVHVSTLADAKRAVRAGAHGLVHLFADEPVDAEFLDMALESGLFVIPTLSVLEGLSEGEQDWPLDDAVLARLDAAQRQSLEARFNLDAGPPAELPGANLRAIHEAGIPILAGTDAPNPGTAHGISLHRELALLYRAGLSVIDVLRAATSLPARYFPIGDRGAVAVGHRADLVLVGGDVREDISSSLAIHRVWKNGHPVDLRALAPATVATAARSMESGLVSDFKTGLLAMSGSGWMVTTDGMRGGASQAQQDWDEEGHGTPGSIKVTGEVLPGFAWPWAGTVYFPGDQPMQAVAFDPEHTLAFAARGDGAEYHVLFLSDTGAPPVRYAFVAGPDWTEVDVKLSDLPGLDPSAIAGIVFAAGPNPGGFSFQLDDVVIR